jgi:hypothetical protein
MTKQDLVNALTRRPVPFTPTGSPGVYLMPMGIPGRVEIQTWRNGLGDSLTADLVEEMNARLWIASVCDEAGELIFSIDDLPVVRKLLPSALVSVGDRVMDLNGFTKATTQGNASTPN